MKGVMRLLLLTQTAFKIKFEKENNMKKTFLIRLWAFIILSAMLIACFSCTAPETENDTDSVQDETGLDGTLDGDESDGDESDGELNESNGQNESGNTDESEKPVGPGNSDESDNNDTQGGSSSGESESDDQPTETCEHLFAADESGHWKPACDICGKPEGSKQNHEIREKIKDMGDRLAYIYLCSICEFVVFKQELSYDINVYIPPTDLAAANCYNLTGVYYFEDNVGFTRFTSSGSGAYIRAYEDTACEDVSGRYLIMKTRLKGGSAMSLHVKSGNAKSSVSVTACDIGEDWSTLIIDLAAIGDGKNTGYAPDGGGDYYLENLRIYFDAATLLPAGGYADISYITIVETMEDAYEFVGEGNTLYIYNDIAMNPFPTIEGTTCEHTYTYTENGHSMSACDKCGAEAIVDAPHVITEKVESRKYTYVCECGYTFDTSKVVSSDVNTFLSPSFIAKHADNTACWSSAKLMFEEGNEPFARIYGKTVDAAGRNITDDKKIWNLYSNGTTPTGQYFVIKYRVPNNNLLSTTGSSHTQNQIRIYTSTQRNGATDEKDGVFLPVWEDNNWKVAIINLSTSVGNSSGSTYLRAEDGTYTMKFMQLRLFYGGLSSSRDYTDIAYVAYCDSLDEAVSIVKENEYYFQSEKGDFKHTLVQKDQGPVEDTEPENPEQPLEQHVITESYADGKYTFTCSHCNNTINSITVPSNVNKFYSPVYLSTATGYHAVTAQGLGNDGTLFTRLTSVDGNAFEYYLVNRQGAPATDAGAFRYIALRIRVSDASKHVNLVFNQGTSETSIRINDSLTSGEWATVVIDMNKIAPIVQSGSGYPINSFLLYTGTLGTDYIDIAHVGLYDSWDELTPVLADESTVKLIVDKSKPAASVNAADGGCVVHSFDETVSNNVYSYSCITCGQIIAQKTVPTNTNLYISAGALGSNYGFKNELLSDNGIVFQRFTSNSSSGHVYVRNAATLADSGKLLVMKIRVGSSVSAFVLEAGADTLSGITQEPVMSKGAWQTVVVDLSQFANYKVDAENGNVCLRFTLYGSAGFTLDVAYVAIVDDRSEVATLIDEQSYNFFTNWKVTPVVVDKNALYCDVCPTTETANGNTYSYSNCTICGRSFADTNKTVSSDITKYYSASALASASSYNANKSLLADETGEAFVRLTSSNGNAFEYYIVNKQGLPATDPGEPVKYVMFKVRMSDINQEYIFSLYTKGGKGALLALHNSVTKANEWVTVVFDMDSLGKLEANSDGTYALQQFFAYTSATGTNTLDIACVAFCNSWAEIASASGDSEAMLVTSSAKGTLVSTLDGSAK